MHTLDKARIAVEAIGGILAGDVRNLLFRVDVRDFGSGGQHGAEHARDVAAFVAVAADTDNIVHADDAVVDADKLLIRVLLGNLDHGVLHLGAEAEDQVIAAVCSSKQVRLPVSCALCFEEVNRQTGVVRSDLLELGNNFVVERRATTGSSHTEADLGVRQLLRLVLLEGGLRVFDGHLRVVRDVRFNGSAGAVVAGSLFAAVVGVGTASNHTEYDAQCHCES